MSDLPDADDSAVLCLHCGDRPKLWEDDMGWNCMCPCRWFRGSVNCHDETQAIGLWNALNTDSGFEVTSEGQCVEKHRRRGRGRRSN